MKGVERGRGGGALGIRVAKSKAGFDFTFASTAVDICPMNPSLQDLKCRRYASVCWRIKLIFPLFRVLERDTSLHSGHAHSQPHEPPHPNPLPAHCWPFPFALASTGLGLSLVSGFQLIWNHFNPNCIQSSLPAGGIPTSFPHTSSGWSPSVLPGFEFGFGFWTLDAKALMAPLWQLEMRPNLGGWNLICDGIRLMDYGRIGDFKSENQRLIGCTFNFLVHLNTEACLFSFQIQIDFCI